MFKGTLPWLRHLLSLTMLIGLLSPIAAAAAADFVDVPSGHIFATEIGWLADEAITLGCNPPTNDQYCPDDNVTRGQMAAFLVRALGLSSQDPNIDFTDDNGNIFENDIEKLATAGITLGCNPPTNDQYCPDDNVTRGQMAAFLVRALGLSGQDPNIDFTDDNGNIFENDIEKLATAGITLGCNPPTNDQYCPDDNVTRGQMAAFLYRALTSSTPPPPPPPPAAVEVTTMSLANAAIGMAYNETLNATGGTPPYEWEITIGDLPDGLSLSAGGTISGTPTEWGTYDITVQATDQAAGYDTEDLTLVVDPEPLTVIDVVRASVASDGSQALDDSFNPAISADGRFIAFQSEATNLVPGDTNGAEDVFVHDTATMTTTRVSVSSTGTEGDGSSYRAAISGDGRYVAFESVSTNLVPSDTNSTLDIFVHDLQSGDTVRASVASDGSEGTGSSYAPSLAPGGRYVVFESNANNLVAGDTNNTTDVFAHDLKAGKTIRVSVTSAGLEATSYSRDPVVSSGATYVAFTSGADNLVAGDTNAQDDIFLRNTATGTTSRVSVSSLGTEGTGDSYDPAVSPDGRYVVFISEAEDLVAGDSNGYPDAFLHDTSTGSTTLVSVSSLGVPADEESFDPAVSLDGRYVAFRSQAGNLDAGDINGERDVFIHDTVTGTTRMVSVSADGIYGNRDSDDPVITPDGRYVAFESNAFNLIGSDTNGIEDIYRVELYQ